MQRVVPTVANRRPEDGDAAKLRERAKRLGESQGLREGRIGQAEPVLLRDAAGERRVQQGLARRGGRIDAVLRECRRVDGIQIGDEAAPVAAERLPRSAIAYPGSFDDQVLHHFALEA